MAKETQTADSSDKPTSALDCLGRVMALVGDFIGAVVLILLAFFFLIVLLGVVLMILGVMPPLLNAQVWQTFAATWAQIWATINAPAFLQKLIVFLLLLALLGVFPITYYAYQAHRKDVRIQRLSDEFWLLGLIGQGEEDTVRDLYERIYSSRQYVLYIIVILAFSTFVLLLYAPLSPLATAADGEQPPSGLPIVVLPDAALTTNALSAGAVSGTETMTSATEIRSSAIISGADSITVATLLTTTAIISPSQPITMTTATTTTLPIPAELTGAQSQPVVPQQPDVVRLVFFAYLGAYLYSLIELVRRYNTFDLQPQTYASILVRMVSAVVLVFIGAATIFNAPSTYQSPPTAPGFATLWLPGILAFMIGAFPSRGLDWFRRLADPVLTGHGPATPNVLPLDNLQGMSTWHAARLEQIGIDDAQNLAGADLRKLLLTTQFDTQVMVNWVDQAILYSKVGSDIIKFREKNIPTFTALRRAIKEIKPAQNRSEADKLAIQLGLQGFTELQAFAVDAGFPNYHNLAEYYARSAWVTSRHAQEAQEAIIGQARFQNFDDAIAYGEDFLHLRLDTPEAGLLRTLGTAYYQRAMSRKRRDEREAAAADFDLALQRFDAAIAIDPDNADAYYGRSLCWLEKPPVESVTEQDQWQKTINDCNAAIARNRSFAEAFNTLALAYQRQGNRVLTRQNLEEALRLNDRLAAAYFNRGELYNLMAQEETDGNTIRAYGGNACEDFDKAYLCGHGDQGGIHLGQGRALLGLASQESDAGRRRSWLQQAESHLTEAIGLLESSRLPNAYLARATVFINCGPDCYARAKADLEWIISSPHSTPAIAQQAQDALTNLERL